MRPRGPVRLRPRMAAFATRTRSRGHHRRDRGQRLARQGRRGISGAHQVAHGARHAGRREICGGQRGRGRLRHVCGSAHHGRRSVPPNRRHVACGTRGWRAQGHRLPALRISAGSTNLRAGDRICPRHAPFGNLRHRTVCRRRRLYLRRGDLAPRKPRRQTRRNTRQTTCARRGGPFRQADAGAQRHHAVRGVKHPGERWRGLCRPRRGRVDGDHDVSTRGQCEKGRADRSPLRYLSARPDRRLGRGYALGASRRRGPGGRPAGRLSQGRADRYADDLRSARRHRRRRWPRRDRGVRRHRRSGAAGPLCIRVLRP